MHMHMHTHAHSHTYTGHDAKKGEGTGMIGGREARREILGEGREANDREREKQARIGGLDMVTLGYNPHTLEVETEDQEFKDSLG